MTAAFSPIRFHVPPGCAYQPEADAADTIDHVGAATPHLSACEDADGLGTAARHVQSAPWRSYDARPTIMSDGGVGFGMS